MKQILLLKGQCSGHNIPDTTHGTAIGLPISWGGFGGQWGGIYGSRMECPGYPLIWPIRNKNGRNRDVNDLFDRSLHAARGLTRLLMMDL